MVFDTKILRNTVIFYFKKLNLIRVADNLITFRIIKNQIDANLQWKIEKKL